MFFSVLHSDGRLFSADTPFDPGPRHCGQFSAASGKMKKTQNQKTRMPQCTGLIGFSLVNPGTKRLFPGAAR
jgi:hypothetical protein